MVLLIIFEVYIPEEPWRCRTFDVEQIEGEPQWFGPLGLTAALCGVYGYWEYSFQYVPGEPIRGFFKP